jgi:hypothetical protein
MVAMVLFLALAILTLALILIKRIVRKNDVIRGDYVENDEEVDSPAPPRGGRAGALSVIGATAALANSTGLTEPKHRL